jgi:hypothetical protein
MGWVWLYNGSRDERKPMDTIVPYEDTEKPKHRDYFTDWEMVRQDLSVYTTVVWLTFVTFSILLSTRSNQFTLAIACTALLVVLMYLVSRILSLVMLLVSWIIHFIAIRTYSRGIAFHDAIHQFRNTWIVFTILLWLRLIFGTTSFSTGIGIILLVGFPAAMTYATHRIYQMILLQSFTTVAAASIVIGITSAVLLQLLQIVF